MIKSKYSLVVLLLQLLILPAYGITARFTYTKISNCAPTIVKFINNSTYGPGITYTWNFGLGAVVSASDNSSKEQLYTKSGQYKVSLKVTDGINTDSTSTIITIYAGPAANFSADKVTGCPPLMVNFTSTSVMGESDIVSTLWDFRNGNYKEGLAVPLTYYGPGMYDVILKVIDKNGCSSILESDKSINVTKKPEVNFAASDTFACSPPVNISFTNLSSGSSELKYKWDFGNGKTSADISNSSVYNSIGSYSVKLKATDQAGCSDSIVRNSYITIGYPKAALSVYDSYGKIVTASFLCDGTYRFVYPNAGLPDYTWIISDNGKITTFSGKNTLSYRVTGTGKIDIKLVYGRNLYCTDSVKASFMKSYIRADFTPGDTLICSLPSRISLVNSSENADRITWYLSDKLLSDQNASSYTITEKDLPAETWQQHYNHGINIIKLPFKLVASNGGVCFDSITREVSLIRPSARFIPDKVSGCVPLQVNFSDSSRSVYNIDSYTYKIGRDSVMVLKKTPVNYTFTKPGKYNISEIIRSGGCIDTSEIVTIVAGDKIVPYITVTPAEVCNGGSIHLTADAGNTSPVSMWRLSSTGIFDLSFRSKPDTVITVYSDSSGYKDINLQVDYYGCLSDTIKKSAFKVKGPVGRFTESFSCDSSLTYHFKSGISPATSLIWNIDTATFSNVDSLRYQFPASGNYNIKLIASDIASNCSLSRIKQINVRRVMADFSLNDTIFCAGDTVRLNASSSRDYVNNCYNEGFLWDFGDDSPPRRTFLTMYDHIYTSKGTDTIKLDVKADNGCTASYRRVARVFRPEGSFTADKTSGCLPALNINFTNVSTDKTIVGWIWNFGDKSSDSTNTISVNHLYKSEIPTTFYPFLKVYDAYQCSGISSIPVLMKGVYSDFQANNNAICAGESVTFTPADSTLSDMLWNFGDGSPPGRNKIHTYISKGQFNVTLTAFKEECNSTSTRSKYISVEKADAGFAFGDSIFYCYPDTLNFVHENSTGSPAVDYLWTFGSHVMTDRNSDSIKYTFTRPGNYTAQLIVRTLNGCTAGKIKHITIKGPEAYATFTPSKICYGDAVYFKIDSLKNVSQWKWLFGDGITSAENPVSHRFTSRGKIIPAIELNSENCNAIQVLDTLLVSRVKAGFSSTDSSMTVCYGNKLNLVNSSVYSSSWNWDVDNLKTSTDFNLDDILFSNTGEHYIRLIAAEESGCTDTLVQKFIVVPIPVFSISGDSTICSGKNSVIMSVKNNPGDKILWTPVTGLSDAASFTVTASPTAAITYTALLTDVYGCMASKTKTILVNQPFDLNRSPLGDTTIYLGEKIQLTVLSGEGNLTYSWSPDYSISCLKCNNPWVAPEKTITYTVETKNECFDFKQQFNVEVINDFYLEAPTAFTPNGDSNNDIFLFEEKNIKNFDFKIFNRWGENVFSTTDLRQGWDGNVNGHPQNVDTYVYSVKAETIHGYKFDKKGEFLLLR